MLFVGMLVLFRFVMLLVDGVMFGRWLMDNLFDVWKVGVSVVF